MRKNISSGAEWEDKVAYSRAVRVENIVEVSGTVSSQHGQVVGKGDAYQQTKCILSIISQALKDAGANIKDVVRTRIYVTQISDWEEIGRAHEEVFKNIRPATSMVEVKALISEDYLVEIEATAIIN